MVNDQIGSPTWSVALSKVIADLSGTQEYGIYHATNDGQCSWYEFAKSICNLAGFSGVTVTPVSSSEINLPAKRPAYSKLNTDALENTIGYKLQHWEQALQTYITSRGKQ